MRRLAFLLAILLSATVSIGQGFVLFASRVNTPDSGVPFVDAPVFLFQNTNHGPGREWSAQLVQLTNGTHVPLQPTSYFLPIGLGAAPIAERYVWTQTIEVPGVLPGETATFVMRAWKSSFGGFAAAASQGFFGESLPVTVTLGTATNPAPLIGLQSFQVGPFSTNFTAALNITDHPLSLLVESIPPWFHDPNQRALENTIERSANLKDWEPVVSLFSFYTAVGQSGSVQLPDRAARLLFSDAPNPVFVRLRYGVAWTLSPEEWDQHAPARYRFTYHYYRHDNGNENPISFSETITVESSRVTSITNVTTDGIGPEYAKTLFKTVDQLLGIIEENRKNAYLMTVNYDPVHLFPELIEINPFTTEDGKEWGIRHEISNWEVLP